MASPWDGAVQVLSAGMRRTGARAVLGPVCDPGRLTLYTKVHTKSMKPTCSLGSSAALFRSIIGFGGSRDMVKRREQACTQDSLNPPPKLG